MNTNNGWLDIASAPKDGKLILLGCPDEGPDGRPALCLPGHWMKGWSDAPDEMGQDDGWVDVQHTDFYPGRSFGNPDYMHKGSQPTHWMPLPAAPGSPASTVADEGAKDERRKFEAWAGNKGWPLSPYQNNCGIVVAERYGHRTVQKAWEAWQERASTGAPAAGDARDAARYRNFRAALCSLDATWLDNVQAALEGMGLDPDDDVLPTAEQVDAAFDAASQQGGE